MAFKHMYMHSLAKTKIVLIQEGHSISQRTTENITPEYTKETT
jgi:hypothetical protein